MCRNNEARKADGILDEEHQTVIYKYRKSYFENRNDHWIMVRKRSSRFFRIFVVAFHVYFWLG